MIDTIFLAKVIGIFALLEGFSMILRRRMLLVVFHEMARMRILSYIIGAVMAILGLVVVVGHTVFADMLSSTVTIIGWFICIEGVLFLFFSQTMVKRMIRALDHQLWYSLISAGYLILGVYLAFSVLL